MPDPPTLIYGHEAAKVLNVKPGTLRKWRSIRKGPPWIEVEGVIRYSVEALQRYLTEQTVTPNRENNDK